jgi:hypothetical protein
MQHQWIVGGLLALLLLAACSRVKPEEPMAQPFGEVPAQLPSVVSLPLLIPMPLLVEKINAAIKPDIVKDDRFDNPKKGSQKADHLKLHVSRAGNISLKINGNRLFYAVPLNVVVEREIIGTRIFKKDISASTTLAFGLTLSLVSQIAVGSDWRLATQTTFQQMEFHWNQSPNIPGGKEWLGNMIQKKLMQKMPELTQKIDQIAHDNLKLDRMAANIWKNLQKPILINKKGEKIWLKVRPEKMAVGQVDNQDNQVLVPLHILAFTQTLVGENPQHAVQEKLPPLLQTDSTAGQCDFHLFSELKYEEINAILDQKLGGKSFDVQGNSIKIKNVRISGNGGNELVIRLDIGGAVAGRVFLKGQPHYDSLTQTLSIRDFDFDVNSEETLLTTADWLLHDSFREKVQAALHLPLADKIQQIPQLIHAGLEKGKLGEKIDLQLTQWQMGVEKISVRPNALLLLIGAKANAAITLEKL